MTNTATVEFTLDELAVLRLALDGFEPDTASYDPDDSDPMGWSPEEVATLDRIFERCARAERELGATL